MAAGLRVHDENGAEILNMDYEFGRMITTFTADRKHQMDAGGTNNRFGYHITINELSYINHWMAIPISIINDYGNNFDLIMPITPSVSDGGNNTLYVEWYLPLSPYGGNLGDAVTTVFALIDY